jgi:6-phosphogluconolactonase
MAIIQTSPTPEDLALAAANHFSDLAQEAIVDHGYFAVALAGGSTPKGMYRTLATIEFAQQVNWELVHVFWGDERTVPPDHEQSNYRMAKEAMLDFVPIPKENIHRILGEIKPLDAARLYQRTIEDFFKPEETVFDLILLGMGDDGHTASLFPGNPAILGDTRLVAATFVEKLDTWRITFTPTLINAANNVTFLVSGEKKAWRLRQVLVGRYQPEELPSQIIRPTRGKLRWLIDKAAALHL